MQADLHAKQTSPPPSFADTASAPESASRAMIADGAGKCGESPVIRFSQPAASRPPAVFPGTFGKDTF